MSLMEDSMIPAEDDQELTTREKAVPLESVWLRIRDHLENRRDRISEEIKSYPTPIPACDVQFNYLLEQRAGVAQELNRLAAVHKEHMPGRDENEAIDEFIEKSDFIDEDAKVRIRSSILAVFNSGA
jgi:hypothetical protein